MDPNGADAIVSEMLDRMMDFESDPVGNAGYISDHYGELNEETRERWYKLLIKKRDRMPREVCEIIDSLKDRVAVKQVETSREFSILAKMSDFDDDILGGAQYVKKHFDELSEPTKDMMFNLLMEKRDEMPKEAQTIVTFLGFRCEAGRKRMIANLEKSASKLPDGKLKRDMIG